MKDAEKQTEKIRGGMKQDKQLGEYGGVSDEKQKLLEEVLKRTINEKPDGTGVDILFKYGIELAIDLAFAKGEEKHKEELKRIGDKYRKALSLLREYDDGNSDLIDCIEKVLYYVKQSEQRGYERGYDEGYTDGINNGTYRLKKPTTKKEVK